jgi:hypothetical protein
MQRLHRQGYTVFGDKSLMKRLDRLDEARVERVAEL